MNEKSEQIDAALNYSLDFDQPLDWREEIFRVFGKAFNRGCFSVKTISVAGRSYKIAQYESTNGAKHCFLLAAVTFVGGHGNHPIFKKRIQLKTWYKAAYAKLSSSGFTVHFTGVYHYNGNVLFVDFGPETYVQNLMHSSSAFVYINDLYRAMKDGVAFRRDFHGHGITTIAYKRFEDYIESLGSRSCLIPTDDLTFAFAKFNKTFPFLKWIKGIDAIKEMRSGGWPNWRQTEWAGWYLEYLFSNYLMRENEKKIVYCKNKKKGALDFDLWFPAHKFYGDLKASDAVKEVAPGNDQESLISAINRYDRFWYVIFEHETINDSDSKEKFSTERRIYLLTVDGVVKSATEKAYHRDLKYKVCFNRMLILEINRFNFQDMLTIFNQGRQPDGAPRKKKFLIRKRLPVDLENYQIMHYAPPGKREKHGCVSCAALSGARK